MKCVKISNFCITHSQQDTCITLFISLSITSFIKHYGEWFFVFYDLITRTGSKYGPERFESMYLVIDS